MTIIPFATLNYLGENVELGNAIGGYYPNTTGFENVRSKTSIVSYYYNWLSFEAKYELKEKLAPIAFDGNEFRDYHDVIKVTEGAANYFTLSASVLTHLSYSSDSVLSWRYVNDSRAILFENEAVEPELIPSGYNPARPSVSYNPNFIRYLSTGKIFTSYLDSIYPELGSGGYIHYEIGDVPYINTPIEGTNFNLLARRAFADENILIGNRVYSKTFAIKPLAPNYINLVSGYQLDARSIPNSPTITAVNSETVTIEYYQRNNLESFNGLTSIIWTKYTIETVSGEKYTLPIKDIVLGTLYISSTSIESSIRNLNTKLNFYEWKHLFPDSISELFGTWKALYDADNTVVPPDTTLLNTTYSLKKVAANNNVWNNGNLTNNIDIGFDPNHPLFQVDEQRVYRYHFKPQKDGTSGDLTMDSPRLIEIHAALNAGKYANNELDPNSYRVSNLGYLIEKLCSFVGFRVDANGKQNKELEKQLTRKLLSSNDKVDQAKYGGNSFAEEGMLVRRLPNYFKGTGIEHGGVVEIHDLPQLMMEILDQLNLAIGLQESGAIEIVHNGVKHQYSSLTALVTEIAIHQFSQSQYARSTHIASVVTQEQTKELIAGLGLPTVSKSLQRNVNGDKAAIPYWGIAPQASLAKRIDTCTHNVGIVLGQLL